MVVVVHLAKNSFILDIRHRLIDKAELFLALCEVSLVNLHVQTGKQVRKDKCLDDPATYVIDLL